MDGNAFRERTKKFALDIIRLVENLPRSTAAEIIGRQLIRSGTSVGANYRAACRSRSVADMIAKLKIVEEESDEAMYWMELLGDLGIIRPGELNRPMMEANEILAMTVGSIKTLRARMDKRSS